MILEPQTEMPQQIFQLPDEIDVGTFTLSISELNDTESEKLSKNFHAFLKHKFETSHTLVATLYYIEIEEVEVWLGSRKSRNKVKLKRKNDDGILGTIKQTAVVILLMAQILSIDPEVVEKNLVRISNIVEKIFQNEGHNINVEQFDFQIIDTWPPFRRHRKYKKKNK